MSRYVEDASTKTLCKDSRISERLEDVQKKMNVEWVHTVKSKPALLTTLHHYRSWNSPVGGKGGKRERRVRLRYTSWLKTPQCTTSHCISTRYWSWSMSQPNKCSAPFGVSSGAQTQWDTYCQGKSAEAVVWVNVSGQKGYRQHSGSTVTTTKGATRETVWCRSPGIAVDVQLLSLYRYWEHYQCSSNSVKQDLLITNS